MTIPLWMLIARIGLMACLYGFLFGAFFMLWRDLRVSTTPDPNHAVHQAELLWRDSLAAPADPFFLSYASHRIGRSPSVEVCLPDDTVSLIHARIWFSENRWWLEDLHSKNGTFLNEMRVDQKIVLSPGDTIRMGRCMLEFHIKG
jgi:hypothetical protein